VNPETIGKSVLYALTVVLILAAFWPFIPSSSPFSQIPRTIEAVSDIGIPAIVVGAPAVAYYLLSSW